MWWRDCRLSRRNVSRHRTTSRTRSSASVGIRTGVSSLCEIVRQTIDAGGRWRVVGQYRQRDRLLVHIHPHSDDTA